MKLGWPLLITMLLSPAIGVAAPEKLEVIFLSQTRTSSIQNYLDFKTKGVYLSSLVAQEGIESSIDYAAELAFEEEYVIDFNDPDGWDEAPPMKQFDCQPMGDGCFNPQKGYVDEVPDAIKASEEYKKEKAKQDKQKDNTIFKLKTFNSDEVQLVECQEGRYFDIFCGKENKRKKVDADLEVWIDTSASMKNVDYSTEKNYCERRFFASRLKKDCRENVEFSVFDTGRKSLGSYDTLCDYVGSNDSKRIVRWIESSSADHLVVITDVDEYKAELREYLETTNAVVHGIGHKPISAQDLGKFVPKLLKTCR